MRYIVYFDETSDDYLGTALYGGYLIMFDLPVDVLIEGYPVSYVSAKAMYGYDGKLVQKDYHSTRMVSAEYAFSCRNITNPEDALTDLRSKLENQFGKPDYIHESVDPDYTSSSVYWIGSSDTYMKLQAYLFEDKIPMISLEYGISNAKNMAEEISNS